MPTVAWVSRSWYPARIVPRPKTLPREPAAIGAARQRPSPEGERRGPVSAVAKALADGTRLPGWLARQLGRSQVTGGDFPGLEGRLSIHDRHQCELSWTYAASSRKQTRYRLDVYFFLPSAIGVTPDSYDPAAFFADTQAYIRLVPPRVGAKQLADKGRGSPLGDLEMALKWEPELRDQEQLVQKAKLVGCVVRGAIRRQRRKALQACLADSVETPKLERRVGDFCATVAALLQRFREVGALASSERMSTALGHVDDFLSMLAVEAACDVLHALQEREEPEWASACEAVAGFVTQETSHREGCGWPTLHSACPADLLETMMYRRSQLKKFVFGSLFLKVKPLRSRNVMQHLFGAIGACIAAVWAFFSNPALFGTVTINSLTFAVLFVAVFAYILKDRIKELTKQYLSTRMRRWMPDRDRQVLPPDLVPQPAKPIGRIREYIDFVAPTKLDPEIKRLRNAVHTIDVGEDAVESILHYSKTIELRPHTSSTYLHDGIKDILRFSIRHFLTRLDESPEVLHAFEPETGRVVHLQGGHVYHVNVAMRCVAYGPDGRPGTPTLERIRLILQKSGIVRVEPVVTDEAQERADEEQASDESD